MRFLRFAFILVSLVSLPLGATAQSLDAAKIDAVFGRPGQKIGDVYRVGFPRTDLHVVIEGMVIQPGFALGSWAAFSGSDSAAAVMGDLVLLPSEVEPVLEKLRGAGLQISAIHNHLPLEAPRIVYLHYMGHGPAAELAKGLRAALDASGTPLGALPAAVPVAAASPGWVAVVEGTLGRKGSFKGGVLAIGVPRPETLAMDGMTLSPAQGVAESLNFQEAGPGKIATTGDFVLVSDEVNPVISALTEHGISVTALHSHMLNEQPRLFFMHFWAVGSPESVATGIKAGLSRIGAR
jgi:Domain of Unknown Function (DUF1259)